MVSEDRTKVRRYNIVTFVTFDEFPFFLIFLNSFFRNVEHELVDRIYVVIDKLPVEFLSYLSQFERLEIIVSETCLDASAPPPVANCGTSLGGALMACQAILLKSELPLFLLDSDAVFVGEVAQYIHTGHDVLVTSISNPAERIVRRDGLKINFTSSALVFNNTEASLRFIERWQDKVRYVACNFDAPYEDPALNLILEEEVTSQTLSIGVVSDQHVFADQFIYPETKILHLKTWDVNNGGPIESFYSRIARRQWAPEHAPANYLDALCFERWIVHQLGYSFKSA